MMHDELLDGTETRDRTMAAWLAYGHRTAPRTVFRVRWTDTLAALATGALFAGFIIHAFYAA